MSQLERISKAKTRILYKSNQTFIATILLSLRIEEDNSQPTLMVGQGSIKYNSDFLATLSDDLLISALLHESWHIAYDHAGRLGNRDPFIYNQAADYVINLMLKEQGFSISPDWLYDPMFTGWSSEEVYEYLVNNPKEDMPLEVIAYGKGSDPVLLKAYETTKALGMGNTIPPEVQELIEKFLYPKLDWRALLQSWMNKWSNDDYSMKRPSSLSYAIDTYLPSLYSETSIKPIVVIDVSGSVIGQEFLDMFFKELAYMQELLNIQEIRVITFDTVIRADIEVEESFDLQTHLPQIHGGGGTDIHPVFNLLRGSTEPVIVFTDLMLQMPPDPSLELLWIIFDNPQKPPYGDSIHIKSKDLCT